MSRLALFTLGPPRLDHDGVPVPIRRRRVMALLVYLAVTGRTHRRDTLAALFYPEHDQSQARARLRRTLSWASGPPSRETIKRIPAWAT